MSRGSGTSARSVPGPPWLRTRPGSGPGPGTTVGFVSFCTPPLTAPHRGGPQGRCTGGSQRQIHTHVSRVTGGGQFLLAAGGQALALAGDRADSGLLGGVLAGLLGGGLCGLLAGFLAGLLAGLGGGRLLANGDGLAVGGVDGAGDGDVTGGRAVLLGLEVDLEQGLGAVAGGQVLGGTQEMRTTPSSAWASLTAYMATWDWYSPCCPAKSQLA